MEMFEVVAAFITGQAVLGSVFLFLGKLVLENKARKELEDYKKENKKIIEEYKLLLGNRSDPPASRVNFGGAQKK